MSTNEIKIKRSAATAVPSSLVQGELAYSESTGVGEGVLYIGIAGASMEIIGGYKYVQQLLNFAAADINAAATNIVFGRDTAGAGPGEEIGEAAFKTMFNLEIGTDVQAHSSVLDATTASFLIADESKLDGITITGALTGDVTTSANVATIPVDTITYAKMQNVVSNNVILGNNAGAGGPVDELTASEVRTILGITGTPGDLIYDTDTSVSGWAFVLDEDNMASNSATKLATQQSIKAYVDSQITGGVSYKGPYDASSSPPDATPEVGDMYTVTVGGTGGGFWSTTLAVGDVIIAETTGGSVEANWTVVEGNQDMTAFALKATTMTAGIGLTGGGSLAANRTFNLDIGGLTAESSTVGSADYLAMLDATGGVHRKVLINNILDGGTF